MSVNPTGIARPAIRQPTQFRGRVGADGLRRAEVSKQN